MILKYSICYTNVISIQDAIVIAKILNKNAKKKLVINMHDVEVIRVWNTKNILPKYNWYLDSTENRIVIAWKLENI